MKCNVQEAVRSSLPGRTVCAVSVLATRSTTFMRAAGSAGSGFMAMMPRSTIPVPGPPMRRWARRPSRRIPGLVGPLGDVMGSHSGLREADLVEVLVPLVLRHGDLLGYRLPVLAELARPPGVEQGDRRRAGGLQ